MKKEIGHADSHRRYDIDGSTHEAVTAVFLSLWFYRSLAGMKEEDTLILSAAESKLEEEQKQIQVSS